MKTTYNWLRQYINLSDITPEKVAELMTKSGLEVEDVSKIASGDNLVIGEVLECVDHPNSDHLHVCQVDTGDTVRQIVCGAPNVAKGQKVIVALPGCHLPGGEIQSGVIRGEQSDGMICSLAELGVDKKQLSEQQLAGIEVLNDEAVVGNKEVLNYLGLDDTVYDVSLTPNRADCLAAWSLAKEVAAILDREAILPDCKYECQEEANSLKLATETEKCSRFEGKVIKHVTIKPSPKWLQEALTSVGVKAINNVVDISNYVMLETGQPLHFYDLAKIDGPEITVKTGLKEKYTALDGIEYDINEEDIMITNNGKAIGIAGIMGGDDSKIDENTKGIIIEAATFNNVSVRNTARRLNLDTEAATRFQKGIDPEGGHKAVERSVQLLIDLAEASGIEETIVVGSDKYVPTVIECSVKQINKHLGTSFTPEQVISTFRRLDFSPERLSDDAIKVTIPSYRTDVKIWEDLTEEVIRILGYENIASTLPLMPTIQGGLSSDNKKKRSIQKMLVGNGLNEIITYSLVSKAKIDDGILNIGEAVEIANALSDERRYLRTSILPSMLDVASYNAARKIDEFGLFEISNVYDNNNNENLHLGIVISEHKTISKWQHQKQNNDFYTMKGLVVSILDQLGYGENRITFKGESNSNNLLHPYQSACIYLGNSLIGKIGVILPQLQQKLDVDKLVLAEINLSAVFTEKSSKIKFNPIPRYPAVSYDISMIVSKEITGEEIVKVTKKAAGQLLKGVEIIDVYQGKNIEDSKQSITISITFQSAEKTLTEDDIKPSYNEVIKQLVSKVGAVIRDS